MQLQSLTSFSVLTLALLAGHGCQSQPSTVTPSTDHASRLSTASGELTDSASNTAIMWVHGMACPQCAYNVDLQLLKVPGVESVHVDLSDGKVVAALSATNPPGRDELAAAIERTGFTLVKIEVP
jgi:copper chaperone CopZ